MTTIAYDGKTIAADGLRLWNHEYHGDDFEKIRVDGRVIYAYSGDVPLMTPVIDWHRKGADVKDVPSISDENWVLLVIDDNGLRKYSSSSAYPEWFKPPFAIGAGAEYALGMMWAGHAAREVIEIVARHTYSTGGKIMVVDVAEVLSRPELHAAAE